MFSSGHLLSPLFVQIPSLCTASQHLYASLSLILFISDIHLGHGRPEDERKIEADLVNCLSFHEEQTERLYLLGDVFDQYIEYRHLVPKGFVRLQGLLARWTDQGIPVTYLAGNHDPWHRDYFEQELGVRIIPDVVNEPLYGQNVYLAHGDGFDRSSYIYNRLRPLLRHPIPVWMYTRLLPGDASFSFARKVKHLSRDASVDPVRVESLRRHAQTILNETAAKVVVMGHTHHPELSTWPEGVYLNTGFWRGDRTFGSMEPGRLRLLHWNGTCSEEIQCSHV
jgi:UDP-2,3-diacylglucosamine hydrolase